MRPSRTAVNGLWLQKSDCMTFLSTHRTTAPRSSDHDARALINEAITAAVAECNCWRAGHIHDENSTTRPAHARHVCSTCRACYHRRVTAAASMCGHACIMEPLLHGCRVALARCDSHAIRAWVDVEYARPAAYSSVLVSPWGQDTAGLARQGRGGARRVKVCTLRKRTL